MKFIHYLYIAPLAFLAACSNEDLPSATEKHPDGAIQLSAGIVEGGSQLMTRAGAESFHSTHLNLAADTKLALQVSGTWTGHSPSIVVQTTTATVGAATGADSKHNALSCSPVLYWDDYGTADPANASSGRTDGLTIYGAAINGKTTAPTVANYTALSWTLAADQTTTNNTPADKDLLISNNVQPSPGASTSNDGTYKFADYFAAPTTYTKLLEFRHALSKITVLLDPGAGFGDNFAATPEVILTSNDASTSNTEWPYTTGTVNVTNGAVTSQGGSSTVTMYTAALTPTETYTVKKEALVMPGSAFASSDAIIAKIIADGNVYYVSAEMIRAAINTKDGTSIAANVAMPTIAGRNYIIKVTVDKTAIKVTATVTDWSDVEAAVVNPVINVDDVYGTIDEDLSDGFAFSFYRSTSLNNGYSANKPLVDSKYYPEESVATKSSGSWTMSPTLYWPDHNTHYQFRGVWPRTESVDGPRVEDGSGDTDGYQVIKVQNVAYDDETFPSDLQIARPEFADHDQTCTNNEDEHTTTNLWSGGICATEGDINLNFKYMMSQVEVNLSTTDNSLGDAVRLTGAVVEIVNVYTNGDVKLGDRSVVPTGSTGSYTLNTAFQGHDNENNVINITSHPNRRWSAIVPQMLTYSTPQASTNVRFKITITNADSSTDIYYADVKPIPVTVQGSSAPAAPITAWESGKHYIYNLLLSKTKVNVTATLANWTTVTANDNGWF